MWLKRLLICAALLCVIMAILKLAVTYAIPTYQDVQASKALRLQFLKMAEAGHVPVDETNLFFRPYPGRTVLSVLGKPSQGDQHAFQEIVNQLRIENPGHEIRVVFP